MDLALVAIITTLAGVAASFVATSLTEWLSAFTKKAAVRKLTIKVGSFEVEVSEDPDKTLREIADRIAEVQQRPRVFLSYTSVDKEFADRLTKNLRERNVEVWAADEQIQAGDSISQKIKEGLTSSQWVIFLVSEDSMKSTYINRELELALDEEKGRERPFIIPVLIKGDQIPDPLKDKAYADFRSSYDAGLNNVLAALKVSPLI